MNLSIILFKITNLKNSNYSVILFSTQTTCGLKLNFKVLPEVQSSLYHGFYFYPEKWKLCQFLPAPKQSRKQKEHEKVERDIWGEPLFSKGLRQSQPSEALEQNCTRIFTVRPWTQRLGPRFSKVLNNSESARKGLDFYKVLSAIPPKINCLYSTSSQAYKTQELQITSWS